MSGYTAMPDAAWELVYDALRAQYAGREWPEALAVLHLRAMEGERRTRKRKASEWPTVRQLAEEWGWRTPKGEPAKNRVSAFLTRTREVETKEGCVLTILHWQDEHRHTPLHELRGDRLMGANRRDAGRERDGNGTGTGRQEPTNAENAEASGTGTGRERDGNGTPRASLPRASTSPPIHDAEGGTRAHVREPSSGAPPDPCPPAQRDPAPSRTPDASTTATGPVVLASDGRPIPATLDELLGGEVSFTTTARALVYAGITPAILLAMTPDELRVTKGVAGAWRVIATACERSGFPLGCVPSPNRDPPRGPSPRAAPPPTMAERARRMRERPTVIDSDATTLPPDAP